LTALTRDAVEGTAESVEEHYPGIETRRWLNGQFGQKTPRKQSLAFMEGERRPQPHLIMASASYCLAKYCGRELVVIQIIIPNIFSSNMIETILISSGNYAQIWRLQIFPTDDISQEDFFNTARSFWTSA
jgi:hypothetical protein